MAIPTEKLRNMNKLNVWFAISSILMLWSILWMAYIDYARPWHKYQDSYMAAQSDLAHLDYIRTQQESARQEFEAAAKAVADAQAAVAAKDAIHQEFADRVAVAEAELGERSTQVENDRASAKEAEANLEEVLRRVDSNNPRAEKAAAAFGAARDQLARSEAALASATEELGPLKEAASARPTLAAIQAELAGLRAKFDEIKMEFGAADAVIKVTASDYEHYLGEYGAAHKKTKAMEEQLTHEQEELDGLRLAKEQNEDRQKELTDAIATINGAVTEAEALYNALAKIADDAALKDDQYGGLLVKTAINTPFLDFAAPKGTPSRYEVRQLVLPDIRQRLNYLDSYTTDRCTTCHIAIDDPNFSQGVLAAKLEESLPSINEIRASQGKNALPFPPLPSLSGDTAPKIEVGGVAEHWPDLDADQQDAYFASLLSAVNTYLEDEGREPLALGHPVMAHPDLDLFVDTDSPHPMKSMGCTVCHEGNPQETDFVLAAHTPMSHEQEHEWAHEHYVTAAGVPNATFALVEHYWDRPMLLNKYAEAGCSKCHTQVTDIGSYEGQPQGRTINLGENLFLNAGCANCHLVQGRELARRVGPDLTRVASKLTPGFADQWILNPRAFRPTTWMPHFFLQENNGEDGANEQDPEPALRSETEVLAMRTYLFALSKDWQPETTVEGLSGDAERGLTLFKETGCLACHSNLAEFGPEWIPGYLQAELGKTPDQAKADYEAMDLNQRVQFAWDHFAGDRETIFAPESVQYDPSADYNRPVFTRFAPELSAIGSKVSTEWLYAWLRDPHAYNQETKMPILRLTEQEALDIATYLSTLKHDGFDQSEFTLTQDRKTMADELIFSLLASQRSEDRTHRMMDDEGGSLTEALAQALGKSPLADEARSRFEAMDLQTKRLSYLGSKMISHYGCYACHLIPGFESATRPGTELTTWAEKPISQLDFAFFAPAFDQLRAENQEEFEDIYLPEAEDLIRLAHGNETQEITHTHASFAYHKLRNPRIWDRKKIKGPYEKLKMPNFYFTETEADALVTYLMGRRPPRVNERLVIDYDNSNLGPIAAGRKLTRELNCVGCHSIEDNVATLHQYYRVTSAGRESFDEVNAPPFLRGEGAKIQHSWFFGFLSEVETLRPWLKVRMPSFDLTNDQTTTLVKYFAALSGYESQDLGENIDPVFAYISAEERAVGGLGGGSEAAADESGLEPGADWFQKAPLRNSAAYLADYALKNRLVGPLALMPENTPAKLAAAYAQALDRSEFLRQLYDVPYPFADAPRPLAAKERFDLGEGLVLEMGCLKCHVMGDATVEGANSSPSAPNLNLTFRRLRQEWVRRWLLDPSAIQPGTKMPGLFPEGHSAFVDYGDLRAELEAKYGITSEEQIAAMLDYLYTSGLKNHTTIDPVLAAAAKAMEAMQQQSEDFDEDAEFDEEEFDDD